MLSERRIDLTLFSRSQHSSLSTSDGGEGGHSKSHAPKLLALLQGGQPPCNLPTRGTHPPRSLLFESPPRSFHALLHSRPLRFTPLVSHLGFGGVGGIRTHGPIAGTHAFQACRFDHSRTSPHRFSRGGILACGQMTSKLIAGAHHRLRNRMTIEQILTTRIEIASHGI